jgi:hypothetical protein
MFQTPKTKQEWMHVSQAFEEKWNFPHVLGALDGKHIRIVAPANSGSYYYNYKEFFSIILLAVVNADYEFIFVHVGAEGKASDGGVWQQCGLKEMLEDATNPLQIPGPTIVPGMHVRMPFYLVADDAFRLGPNIQKPFRGSGLNVKQRVFNYRLSRCRRIVENSFGIMASRFRLLRRAIEVNPDSAEQIVMACCILHNFLKRDATSTYMPATYVDSEDENGAFVPGTWRTEQQLTPLQRCSQRNASEYAKENRNRLAEYFVSRHGHIRWQYDNIL